MPTRAAAPNTWPMLLSQIGAALLLFPVLVFGLGVVGLMSGIELGPAVAVTLLGPDCVFAELAQARLLVMRQAKLDVRVPGRASDLHCTEPASIASYGPDRAGGAICACARN